MVQTLNPQMMSLPRELPRAETAKTPVHLFLGLLSRQYKIILFCLVFVSGAGVLYLSIVRPTYTASATMMMDSRQGGIQQKSVLGDTSPSDTAWIDSQIGILTLKRDAIGQSIVRQLRLDTDTE